MLQECRYNTLQIPFDISSLRMHLESFAHEQNIPASHKNVPNIWNAHRIQSEFLECTSIVKECTTKFHSDGIPALVWLPLKAWNSLPYEVHFADRQAQEPLRINCKHFCFVNLTAFSIYLWINLHFSSISALFNVFFVITFSFVCISGHLL